MPGFKDTWNPSLWRRHVAASSRCSRLILWSGAPPPPTPQLQVSLRLPPLCKGRGELGSLAHQSSRSCKTRSPVPSGASRRLPLSCAGVQTLPPTPFRRSPSLPPSSPAAKARTPGLRHVGAREAAVAAAAAGARARARARARAETRRRYHPPCCGLCGRLPLSLCPEPSPASPESR